MTSIHSSGGKAKPTDGTRFGSSKYVSLTVGTMLALAAIVAPALLPAQDKAVTSQGAVKPFPEADFVLRGQPSKPQRPRTVLGPIESDGKGGSKGTFAVYGSLPVEVSTIAFSGDGKVLAVGYTPGFVDLWDVENHKKLRTLEGGTAVALTRDGALLAKDGEGIEFCESRPVEWSGGYRGRINSRTTPFKSSLSTHPGDCCV